MRIAEVVESEMRYSARTWDREVATRYVLDLTGRMVEFSHFRHFLGECYVKDVVEIACSFGCTVGCHHCAAADLPHMQPLAASEVIECVELVAGNHGLTDQSRVLMTYSGIGEASLLRLPVFESAVKIQVQYPHAQFVLTTVGIRPHFLGAVGSLSESVDIKYLQVSVFSADDGRVHDVMPLGARLGYDMRSLVHAMDAEKRLRYRLNYVVIDGLNNEASQISAILDVLDPVRDRSVLRVSRLNETNASRRNGLRRPSVQSVKNVVGSAQEREWDAYWFYSHGDDQLNCGQLAGAYLADLGIPTMRGK